MRCGSGEHRIKDCDSEPVTSNIKSDSQPKPKVPEKKVAAIEVAEVVKVPEPAQQVSAVQTGKIFDSDEEVLVWDSD